MSLAEECAIAAAETGVFSMAPPGRFRRMDVEDVPLTFIDQEAAMVRRPASAMREPGAALAARAARVVILSLLLATGVVSSGHASPGNLDPTFGGLWTQSVGANVMCHAVAPDGKVVFAGTSGIALLVARRLSNNQPDVSFGGDGSVIVMNVAYPMVARTVAVQADGKIVIAGYRNDTPNSFLVARVTASGQPDPSFNGNGFAVVDMSVNGTDQAEKVLIQPDGKIVVVGSAFLAGDWDFAAARLNSDGSLDASFSGDGKATIGFGGDDRCHNAALQADGKLILVGGTSGTFDTDVAIARLHINGSLDNSFDGDGTVTTGFSSSDDAYAVAIQPWDLRIVVAGRGGVVSRYYSSDGSLDNTFSQDGKLGVPFNVFDASATPGGKIMLAGMEYVSRDAHALRLNANGSLDTEWEGDGDAIVDHDATDAEPPSLSLLPDGRVLTVVPKGGDCWIARWWADGTTDSPGRQAAAFDNITFPRGSQEVANDMAVLPDGKILLAGQVSTAGNTETDFALMRFLSDGQPDLAFGVNGRTELSLGNYEIATAMVVQPDGKIVLVGTTGTGAAANFMIARFNSNGTLDNTFGFGGFNAMNFMGGADLASAVALAPDGRIFVAGTVFNGARDVFGVACFRSDGVADNTFDGDGKLLYEFSVGPTHWASVIVVQGGTKILVGGHVGADFALVRFTMTGALDVAFASGAGRLTRDLGGEDFLEAMVINPLDNRIYAAGTYVSGGGSDWALTRWPASAGPVLCNPVCPWSTGFVDFGSNYAWVNAMDVRSDGHIVVVGTVDGTTVRWAQYAPGSSTPDLQGTTVFPGTVDGVAVRFSGANRVVVAGYHLFQGDRNMTLARFETIPTANVGVEEPTPIVTSVRLEKPSPNPLTNRSTFAFALPRAQSVRLVIHDAAGRLVRTLADLPLPAGRHQRQWDATDDQGRAVSAGIYFARLIAGPEQSTASVVVLR
jgi:uncharacterized delta-60 repeat protein